MADELRVGILGCGDGTHGQVWGRVFASPQGKRFGVKVAKVWDMHRPAAEALAKETGATVVDDPRQAGTDVDGILITELFPDHYLDLARPFLEKGERLFFNRPFAGSTAHAKEILRLAERHKSAVFTASGLDFTPEAPKAKEALAALGPIKLFSMTGPTSHVGFYLPHAIAALVSVLGSGVAKIRTNSLAFPPADPHVTSLPLSAYVEYRGEKDQPGPRGTVQLIGPDATWYGFALKLYGAKADLPEVRFSVSYDPLLEKMVEFFRTGKEPIARAEMLEKTAIYYAILDSAKNGGREVVLADLLRG